MMLEIDGSTYLVEQQPDGFKVTFPNGFTTVLTITSDEDIAHLQLNPALKIAPAIAGLAQFVQLV